jgi:hypothetical protein
MSIVERIKSEMAAFDEKRKALCAELQKEFPALFKEFFEKHEWVENFMWHQYTPYFNDGDECVFGVSNSEDSLEINGVDWYDGKKENKEVYEELSELLNAVPEEFYKDLFGDHVEITVNRDGTITKEEYEHD